MLDGRLAAQPRIPRAAAAVNELASESWVWSGSAVEFESVVAAACRAGGLGRVRQLRRRTGGALSQVFEVVTAVGPEPVIAKVYASEWTWKQRKEVHVYELLELALSGLAPGIIHAWDAGEVGELACTLMTRLPGRPLSEVASGLSPETLRCLYRQLGAMTRRIHSVRQPAFGYVVEEVLEPLPSNETYVRSQFAKKIAHLSVADVPADLVRQVEQRLEASGEALAERVDPVLCHNDLHEGNLLVDDAGGAWTLRGVVDVENAVAADPLHDLAKTDCYSIRGDPAKLAGLLDGYEITLDEPATRTRFDLYRIYHTIELLTWFHQTGQREPLEGLNRQLADLVGTT